MYFTHAEIETELRDNFAEISRTQELHEWADGFVPVYYSDILADWQAMPNEFTDSWKDTCGTTVPDGMGIFGLMSIDLYNYYLAVATEIWGNLERDPGANE